MDIYLSICLSIYLSKLRARLDGLPAPGGGSLLPPLRPGRQRRPAPGDVAATERCRGMPRGRWDEWREVKLYRFGFVL
jgi:hypothetical protein